MSAAKGKAVAVALVGVGAIAAFGFSGSAHAAEAEPEEKKKPAPSKAKVSRVTLAVKFAKVFGVPVSLVLAAISVGRMSLKTAKDIWPKAQAKIGKPWDGTAEGLKDDSISIGLSAYYLGLWWKRYRKNPRQWILAGYAYILGPGRVRKVLPNDAGTLPKPLPSDFARVKAAFAKALTKAEVKKALAQEGKAPSLGAPLSGKALANTIPAETTGYGARKMFGEMTQTLANAYSTLQSYDPNGTAQRSGLDAGSVKAARDYLDSTNTMLAKYYKQMPESPERLTADQLKKLKVAVSTSSTAVKTVNDLFGTTWAMELTKEIGKAAVEVPKAVIHGAAEAVGLDKTSAAIAVAGIIGAGVLVLAIKK